MRRPSPVAAIFFTVLLDMLSFGMAIPDIQLRGESLGAKGWVLGGLIASFSIAQVLSAPYLGRLSDHVGRRKVLLITCTLACLSFVAYAHATAIGWLLLSRVLAGVAGANIGVAFAYIADVTPPEERTKRIGMIGAAFGIGFILGPPLGAYLIKWGGDQPTLLGYFAAVLAAANFVFVYYFVSATKPVAPAERKGGWAAVWQAATHPQLALLIVVFFIINFAFSNLESTYFRLVVDGFDRTKQDGALMLMWVGIVAAIMQGKVVGMVQPILGEAKMVRLGVLLQGPALAAIPFSPFWLPALVVCLLLGVGNGLTGPSINSLISRKAPATMQGGIFGVVQSVGALARIMGPIAGNQLFEYRVWAPYAAAGLLFLAPIGLFWAGGARARNALEVPAPGNLSA